MKVLLAFLFCASSAQAAGDDLSFQAFQRTLYPRLRASCVACHGDGGIAIGHAVADPHAAYVAARRFVDFSDIPGSAFVRQVRNRHWAIFDPTQAGMSESDMISVLEAWRTEGAP